MEVTELERKLEELTSLDRLALATLLEDVAYRLYEEIEGSGHKLSLQYQILNKLRAAATSYRIYLERINTVDK